MVVQTAVLVVLVAALEFAQEVVRVHAAVLALVHVLHHMRTHTLMMRSNKYIQKA